MPDQDNAAEQEAKTKNEEIQDVDATGAGPRRNVHSEEDDAMEQDAPPPMPS